MRMFLAVPASSLAARIRGLPPPPGFRRTPEANLHLTVVFLGEVSEGDLPDVTRAIQRGAEGIPPFTVSFDRLGGMGRGGRSTLWVLEGHSEAYAGLARAERKALRPFGQVRRERKPPRAHLTLGRARRPAPVDERPLDPPARLQVEGVVLYQSDLRPGGPLYIPLVTVPLTGKGGGGPA